MNKYPIAIVIMAVLFTASCSKKASDIVKSIPDHAFFVGSVHPGQIYEKGEIETLEVFTKQIDNELALSIIEDPAKSGIDISEYLYMFAYFIDDEPVLGVTAALKNEGNFTKMAQELLSKGDGEIITHKGYSMITPENAKAAMAWNDNQVIFLAISEDIMTSADWQTELVTLYDLSREEAIVSIVDFNNFTGKMKDMNAWFTGDEMKKLLDKARTFQDFDIDIDIDLPMDLMNNYGQFFVEFADGAMYLTSETHFSDDVTKAASTFMVAKDELNPDLLELTPGNDLLMAMAFSVELDKMVKMMGNFAPPGMDSVSGQIEKATGVPGNEILEAMNGDFVIAVNGAAEGAAIPVEMMIGIGLDDASLQEKLMGTVGNMTEVEKEGDFFMINANGLEIYSGIVNNVWVITNTPGYKDAVTGKGLDKTLNDSKFSDYANGSMGMYLNLDLTTYPAALQAMMAQGGAPDMLTLVSESFNYMGMEASNKKSNMTLKTANDKENSLYTLLKILEKAEESN
ncbi:MAG: DUF4836 family protein [Bacteroidales bacterium]|nr:DUF4836 family protein [Bacteroidales bacterium]